MLPSLTPQSRESRQIMNASENYIRAIRFEHPELIPMVYGVSNACWQYYDQNTLDDLILSHPLLFPDWQPRVKPYVPNFSAQSRADAPYTDPWGCVWTTAIDGLVGTVTSPSIPLLRLNGYAEARFLETFEFLNVEFCVDVFAVLGHGVGGKRSDVRVA